MTMSVGVAAAAIAMTALSGAGAANATTNYVSGNSIYVDYSAAEVQQLKAGADAGTTACAIIPLSPPYNFMCGVPARMSAAIDESYYRSCGLTVRNTPTGSGNSWDKAVIDYFPCGLKQAG
jgi:hypothetical protein